MFKFFFDFTKNERVGIIVLLFIIATVFVIKNMLELNTKNNPDNNTEFLAAVNELEKLVVNKPKPIEIQINTQKFNFDPNTVTRKNLIKLGFDENIAQRVINFREAGGVFKTKSDMKKIYGMSTSLYNSLSDYIVISNKTTEPKKNIDNNIIDTTKLHNDINLPTQYNKVASVKLLQININTADTIQLVKLPGIGPVFAKRIIEYRNFLGGFYNSKQLNEVYGLKPETVESISQYIIIDTSKIIKIDINTATFKELNKHPYINYNQTKTLLKYRQLMGQFKSVNQIIENNIIDKNDFERLKPYLGVF